MKNNSVNNCKNVPRQLKISDMNDCFSSVSLE